MAKKEENSTLKFAREVGIIDDKNQVDLGRARDRLLGEIGMGIGGGDLKTKMWGEVHFLFVLGQELEKLKK